MAAGKALLLSGASSEFVQAEKNKVFRRGEEMFKRHFPSLFMSVFAAFLAVALLAQFGAGRTALAAGAPMPEDDPAKIVKTAMESWSIGWNTGNLDLIVAAVGNGSYWDASLPPEGIKGKALRDYAGVLFKAFPDSKFSYNHVKYTKKAVYWEWTWKATHTGAFAGKEPTNNSIELSGIDVIRARKDGTVSIKSYWNENSLLKGIGAAE